MKLVGPQAEAQARRAGREAKASEMATGCALLAEQDGASVYHADWRSLLDVVATCDLLCTDTPYSAKTQKGHNGAICDDMRRSISYAAWTVADVNTFVESWSPRTAGWFVTITDTSLAPAWAAALEKAGRYVFAPLPFVAPGSTVRLSGDGPSSWTTWIIVARPKTRSMAKWGTLPGAYILPAGQGSDLPVVGGKPIWLMQRLIEDYSRPGDLVVDPCCGAGTTAVAAIRAGRRAVAGDVLRAHADLAALWIKHPTRAAPSLEREESGGQASLFGGAR